MGRAFTTTLWGTPSAPFACKEKWKIARITSVKFTGLKEKPTSFADKMVSVTSSIFSKEDTEIPTKCAFHSPGVRPFRFSYFRFGRCPTFRISFHIYLLASRASVRCLCRKELRSWVMRMSTSLLSRRSSPSSAARPVRLKRLWVASRLSRSYLNSGPSQGAYFFLMLIDFNDASWSIVRFKFEFKLRKAPSKSNSIEFMSTQRASKLLSVLGQIFL